MNRLFAAYESDDAGQDCGTLADALASNVFRFMMLDENLLAWSLQSTCDTRPSCRISPATAA